ncbi:MAG: YqeG family HAD IIIA-type phosphatase [Actinobacteria bacterium]|nr:MAG: YqeG family HAD IIIA-type phosphatase [Actinomycetota bacterium]
MFNKLIPDDYYHSIYDIDLDYLVSIGMKGIIADLDNTLIPRQQNHTSEQLQEWLFRAKKIGFQICIVSNNWKNRVGAIAKKLELPLVARAKKPSKIAFNKAISILKIKEEQTVVIGDQIFTDVLGGNRSGLYTILVVPLDGKEVFATRIARKLENVVLNQLKERNIIPKRGASRAHDLN